MPSCSNESWETTNKTGYMDTTTRRVKITTPCIFDEAGATIPPNEQSPAMRALQQVGAPETDTDTYTSDTQDPIPLPEETQESNNAIKVKLLSKHAITPHRATDGAAGFNLYSPVDITIPPGKRTPIPLDLQLQPPPGTYIQLKSRSGMALKHQTDITAGVIGNDFTGNVTALLHNHGEDPMQIHKGDQLAQFWMTHRNASQRINST
jgi:dUTP pyrophosphatase